MTPIFNSVAHDPKAGTYGDCMAACLSSLLDGAPVPHFLHDACEHDEMDRRVDDFFRPVNLAFIQQPVANIGKDEERVQNALNWCGGVLDPTRIHYMFGGVTAKGLGHWVIAQGSYVVHNPNPDSVIVAPYPDGWFWQGLIVRRT